MTAKQHISEKPISVNDFFSEQTEVIQNLQKNWNKMLFDERIKILQLLLKTMEGKKLDGQGFIRFLAQQLDKRIYEIEWIVKKAKKHARENTEARVEKPKKIQPPDNAKSHNKTKATAEKKSREKKERIVKKKTAKKSVAKKQQKNKNGDEINQSDRQEWNELFDLSRIPKIKKLVASKIKDGMYLAQAAISVANDLKTHSIVIRIYWILAQNKNPFSRLLQNPKNEKTIVTFLCEMRDSLKKQGIEMETCDILKLIEKNRLTS